jgi:hypothetical protein
MKRYRLREVPRFNRSESDYHVEERGLFGRWYNVISVTDRYRMFSYAEAKAYAERLQQLDQFKPRIFYPPLPETDDV